MDDSRPDQRYFGIYDEPVKVTTDKRTHATGADVFGRLDEQP